MQNLDGHRPAMAKVLREHHYSHGARPELTLHAVYRPESAAVSRASAERDGLTRGVGRRRTGTAWERRLS